MAEMVKTQNGCGPIGNLSSGPVDLLVCFAVKEEARFFMREVAHEPGAAPKSPPRPLYQVWMTGMGRRNAVEGIRKAIALVRPRQVITAGFAGGLNPALNFGAIVYDQDLDTDFGAKLEELGAVRATFHCHRRVATTASEKRELWRQTGADVVEMESSVIRTICREQRIPSATIRVISDDARQDLPLDFNALMTPEDRINYAKLAWAVMSRPWRIGKLIEFQQQTVAASRLLGAALGELLRSKRG
jgi:adenosylhomocysteine nucleosidase